MSSFPSRTHFGQTVSTPPKWRLVAAASTATASQSFSIEPPGVVVGRGDEATLRLSADAVSKRHARLIPREEELLVEDLGSRNGVFVNAQRVRRPTVLQSGDTVHFATEGFLVERVESFPARNETFETPSLENTLAAEISRRERAERMLSDTKASAAAVLESIDEGVVTCDESGRIESVNPAAEALLDASGAEAVGRQLSEYIPSIDWSATSLVGGLEEEFPTRLSQPNGEAIPISYRITPARLANRVLRTVVVRDIRRDVATRDRLVEAKAAAEEASEARSRFFANVTHDLKTPLTAIIGYADWLRDAGSTTDDDRAVESIRSNAAHLQGLIEDLLNLSRAEAGAIELDLRPLSVAELLQEVVDSLRVIAEQKGVSLDLTIDASTPVAVLCDALRLRQIMTNLVGNALKFTERGRVDLRCQGVRDRVGAVTLTIEVEDTGPGMDERALDRVFEPFTQADPGVAGRHGGSGLGLAICRRLANLLGGDVTLRSRVSVGTTARVVLSVAEAIGFPSPLEGRRSKHSEVVSLPLTGLRVVVADDADDLRRLITLILTEAGAEVTAVEDGIEAVRAARRDRPDVVVLDCQMPRLDGSEAADQIRRDGCNAAIVGLSAGSRGPEVQSLAGWAFDVFVEKPFHRLALLDAVARAIEARRVPDGRPAEQAPPAGNTFDIPIDPDLADPVVRSIVERFVERSADDLEQLRSLLLTRGQSDAGRLVHRMVGSAGTLGLSAWTPILRRLECSVANSDTVAIGRACEELGEELARTRETLRDLRSMSKV